MCFIKSKKGTLISRYEIILDKITDLERHQKEIIKNRFFTIIHELEKSCNKVHYYFHMFRWLITSGSLIIPALLSIQNIDEETSLIKNHEILIYWITWFLSIIVSGCNAYYTLYKIDKQYYLYHSTYEVIRSEGWQYLQLSGKYSGHFLRDNEKPTHSNQFLYFCVEIERIKMRLVSEEYIKGRDEENNQRKKEEGKQIEEKNKELKAFLPFPKSNKNKKRKMKRRRTYDNEKNRTRNKKDKRLRGSFKATHTKIEIDNLSRASTPPNIQLNIDKEEEQATNDKYPSIISIKSPKFIHKPVSLNGISLENETIDDSVGINIDVNDDVNNNESF